MAITEATNMTIGTAIAGKAGPGDWANRGIGQALADEALARDAKRVYAGTRRPCPDRGRAGTGWGSPAGPTPRRQPRRKAAGQFRYAPRPTQLRAVKGFYVNREGYSAIL